MDRREFLKSGAFALASLAIPRSSQVDTSRDFWEEQSKWWEEHARRYAKALNDICEVLEIPLESPDEHIVLEVIKLKKDLDWNEEIFKEVTYPMTWALIDAGYARAGWGTWDDSPPRLKALIEDKERLEKELAYYKDLAHKPKWLWVGTDPKTGQDIFREIKLGGALSGEDVYRTESGDLSGTVISWDVELFLEDGQDFL